MLKSVAISLIGALALLFSAAAAAQTVTTPEGPPPGMVESNFVVVEVYTCPAWGANPNAVGHFEGTQLMGTLLGFRPLGLTLLFVEEKSSRGAEAQISATIELLRAQGGPFAEPPNASVRITSQHATKEGKPCPSRATGQEVES